MLLIMLSFQKPNHITTEGEFTIPLAGDINWIGMENKSEGAGTKSPALSPYAFSNNSIQVDQTLADSFHHDLRTVGLAHFCQDAFSVSAHRFFTDK